MPALFLYLLKLSAAVSVTWLFYYGVLRPLTFYNWNRWYLLGYTLLSFLIPLIDIGPMVTAGDPGQQPRYLSYIPAMGGYSRAVLPTARQSHAWDPWNFALFLLAAGMILLLIRVLIRWYSLTRVRKQARLISSHPDIRIYQVDRHITPFSFGNAVYINQRLHTEQEWEEIILHEYVHIRQRHTIDILLAELISILNWYNPFVWAIRYSIRQNLEFIADRKVLDNGVDKKGYQYHLLKVVGHQQYRIANNFNFSSLKKRIVMMNKLRSARLHLLKLLFLLPLMAGILLAFRSNYPYLSHGKRDKVYMNKAGDTTIRRRVLTGIRQPKHAAMPTFRDTTPPPVRPALKIGLLEQLDSSHAKSDYRKALFIVDGVERSSRTPDSTLKPADIASMDVLNPDEAVRLFGEKGKYGVVAVLTKAYVNGWGIPSGAKPFLPRKDPVYFVDGVRMPDSVTLATMINPDSIQSIQVLKDQAATALYGPEAGARGVIMIISKSAQKKP